MKYPYFIILFLFAYCLESNSQVYVNVCVVQPAPLSLTQGTITNESCLNSLNGSATVNASNGKAPYSYSWNTVPVQNTQTAVGLAAGTYIASVYDSDSCSSTISVIITRSPDPTAAFSNTNVCHNSATQFTDNSTTTSGAISMRVWVVNDGSVFNTSAGPAHTYTNAGNYNVKLIVNNNFGCADTIVKPVQVYFNPAAGFTHNDVCFNDTMHFLNTTSVDNSTSIASYFWVFGDGSASSNLQNTAHYYTAHGAFNASLRATAVNGCSDTAYTVVNAFDPPASVFTFNPICLYDSAHFINNSVSPSIGSTAGWSWNFGDGSPLSTNVWNPSHRFASPGSYQITLITISSNLGCKDTLNDSILVPPTPIADFSFVNVCLNQAMNFNNLSAVSLGSIINMSWNFGDGSALVTSTNPTHIYANPGTYVVTLIAATDKGCKDTISKSTIVHPLPSVYYTASDLCETNTVHFNNLSTIPSPDIIQSITWNFDDGSPLDNTMSPSHLYLAADSYAVQLIIISNSGCSDSITKTIKVNPNPFSDFNNTTVCQNSSTQFTDISHTATGTISTWLWSFGDGSPVNITPTPSHIYSSAGNHNVTLIVDNSFGCADTIIKPVNVYYNPTAGFTHGDVCFGDTMYFYDASAVDNSTSIATYFWAFGDASPTSYLENTSHFYPVAGVYNVTLVATTTEGCSNAVITPVSAFDSPISACTFSNICSSDAGLFTNTSISPIIGSAGGWSWDFGDGSPLNTTEWSPSHQFAVPGNYHFTLITYSSNLGCSDTLKDSISVFPMPAADFAFTNVCLNQVSNFIDLSIVSGGNIAGRVWDFGDGTSPNSSFSPSHIYAAPGTYSVSLITATNNGCKDTVTKSTVVHPLPAAQFSMLNVCDGSMAVFTDLSMIAPSDNLQTWEWYFGDGSPVNNNQHPSHLYSADGTYSNQLLVVSSFGCKDSISKIISVNPNPIVNFAANDSAGCEPLCVSFQNLSSINSGTNLAWLWSFGDGSPASNQLNPNNCYSNDSIYSPNTFNVALTVMSDSGCISTLTKNNFLSVYSKPVAGFSVQPETASITNPLISISDFSSGADFWHWNFGDHDSVSIHNPMPHIYADTGSYIITLITSTLYNCADTSYQTIIIEPDFLFFIPSVFTPNDDGINDYFSGKGVFIKEFEMRIFDRWGKLIFYSNNINTPWGGKTISGNEPVESGVYVYSIQVKDYSKRKHDYKGIVTLVK